MPRRTDRSASRQGSRPLRTWFPYVLVLPALTLFGIFFAWPAVMAIQLSVHEYSILSAPRFTGLENYRRLVLDQRFWQAAVNSVLYGVVMFPLSVVLPLIVAVALNKVFRGIGVLRSAFYLPVVTPMVAAAVGWQFVLGRSGVVNWFLSLLGIEPVEFLLEPGTALVSVAIVESWKGFGTYMMIYLAGLQTLPDDVIEAAAIDGAGPVRRFSYVILPLVMPFVVLCTIVMMLDAAQIFTSVFVLTEGGPANATLSLGYYIYLLGFRNFEMGYASAVGVVLWIVLVLLAIVNLLAMRRRHDH